MPHLLVEWEEGHLELEKIKKKEFLSTELNNQ